MKDKVDEVDKVDILVMGALVVVRVVEAGNRFRGESAATARGVGALLLVRVVK